MWFWDLVGVIKMTLSQYQRELLRTPWASNKPKGLHFGDTNASKDTPTSGRHGRRPLGQLDITDIPLDLDMRTIMKLPWRCRCGNTLLHRPEFCGRCGRGTPVHEWIKTYART